MWQRKKHRIHHRETFTYYIPSPPSRSTGYREKEIDLITMLFSQHGISWNITNVTPSGSGIWIFFDLTGDPQNFDQLKNSEAYADYKLSFHHNDSDDLELIREGDSQYKDDTNFEV